MVTDAETRLRFEELLEHGVEPAGTDVLGGTVDLGGDPGDRLLLRRDELPPDGRQAVLPRGRVRGRRGRG